jgi:S-DNA-T family DNA segregation ATPase FtsK/SpoIIIE
MRLPLPRPLARLLRRWQAHRQAHRQQRARHLRARRVAYLLVKELHRVKDLQYRITHGKQKDTIRRVQLAEPLILAGDEVFMLLDSNLPPNVKSTDLEKPEILQTLGDRVGAGVRLVRMPNRQLAYATRLAGSTFPATFAYNAYQMPASAPPLAVPLGIDGEGQHSFVDLVKMPHLLIIGPTGKGKSTLIHTMITTWIERNRADEIELWLADHKGGAELNRYTALMPKRGQHRGIVQRFSFKPEHTLEFLEAARQEMKRRLELMRQQDTSDIRDYETVTGQGLRRIVIVIDEIVNLILNKEKVDRFTIGKHAESMLVELASQGRAAGVHVVISTQVIKSEVLTSLIKANFETRICFGVADHWQSLTAIDDSRAEGLPVGRIILKQIGEYTEYQTPHITAHQTRIIVNRIARYGPDGGLGDASEAARFRNDAMLLVKIALDHYDGAFRQKDIRAHDQIRGVIPHGRIDEVSARLLKDGVLIAGKANQPRRVAPLIAKNPDILATMYGPQKQPDHTRSQPGHSQVTAGHSQVTAKHGACDPAVTRHHNAVKQGSPVTCDPNERGYFLAERSNPDDDSDDPPPPDWWKGFEDGAA